MPDILDHHFKMDICNGQCGAQVHILDKNDLEYWQDEAERTNHKVIYSYSVPKEYYMNTYGVACDVYQVLPLDFEVLHA